MQQMVQFLKEFDMINKIGFQCTRLKKFTNEQTNKQTDATDAAIPGGN